MTKLVKEDLVTNYMLDTLLKQLEQRKDEETKLYFDSLASKAIQEQSAQIVSDENKQTIETIFTLNLKASLLTFQKHQ